MKIAPILAIAVGFLLCIVSYEAGQKEIIASCDKISFFYVRVHGHNKTYECLPYTKRMLEPTNPPH